MKKIFAAWLTAVFASGAFAQTASTPSSTGLSSSGGLGLPSYSGNASLTAADIKADVMAADLNRDADAVGSTSSTQKLAAGEHTRQSITGRK